VPISLSAPSETPPNSQVYDVVHRPVVRHPHWISL
jgi:hypothetical protein